MQEKNLFIFYYFISFVFFGAASGSTARRKCFINFNLIQSKLKMLAPRVQILLEFLFFIFIISFLFKSFFFLLFQIKLKFLAPQVQILQEIIFLGNFILMQSMLKILLF